MAGVVYPVHNNKFELGINGVESTSEQMVMPADLENFAPSIDGQTEEWYAMDAEGWAKNIVTGKKMAIDFSGKRSVGDPGNDYVAGLAMKKYVKPQYAIGLKYKFFVMLARLLPCDLCGRLVYSIYAK